MGMLTLRQQIDTDTCMRSLGTCVQGDESGMTYADLVSHSFGLCQGSQRQAALRPS